MGFRFAIVTVVAAMLTAMGASARESGFYVTAVGSYANVSQVGFDRNDRDYIHIRTINEERLQPYRKELTYEMGLDVGYMFLDKGNGPRLAIELGIGMGGTGESYTDVDNKFEYSNSYNEKKAVALEAHMTVVRRMNLGGGMILEPQVSFAYGYSSPSERVYENYRHWKYGFESRLYMVQFVPFVLEHRFEKFNHFGIKVALGSFSYAYCKTASVLEPYQIFSFSLNDIGTALTYYF